MYLCMYVYMYICIHTQICVCVAAVMVTLIPGIIPTEGHSLDVASWHDSDMTLPSRSQSVTGADDFMGQSSTRWHWTIAKEATT